MLAGVVCCDRCDQLQSFNTGQVNLHMVFCPAKLNGQAVGTKVGVLLLLKVTATPCALVCSTGSPLQIMSSSALWVDGSSTAVRPIAHQKLPVHHSKQQQGFQDFSLSAHAMRGSRC